MHRIGATFKPCEMICDYSVKATRKMERLRQYQPKGPLLYAVANLFEIDPGEIRNITVEKTIIGGKIVYENK